MRSGFKISFRAEVHSRTQSQLGRSLGKSMAVITNLPISVSVRFETVRSA